MTKTLRFLAVVFLLVAVITAASAEPVTLEYKYTRGEVDKYRVAAEINVDLSGIAAAAGKNIPPMNITVGVNLVQRTLDVYSDGSAKVKVSYSDPVIQGLPMPAASSKSAQVLKNKSIVMRISKRGKIMSIQGLDKMAAKNGTNLDFTKFFDASPGGSFLPDGPIEVGQSWSESIPVPYGDSQFSVVSTFSNYDEEIWNLRVARLTQSCSGRLDLKAIVESFINAMAAGFKQKAPDLSSMSGNLTLNGQMTNFFAPSIGKLLKSDGNLDAKVDITLPQAAVQQGAPPSLSCTVNLRMSMTRFN